MYFKSYSRWQVIQEHWNRAFSGNLALINFQTELPPPSKMLLHFLKESGSSALSTGSPNKSPSRPSQIVYDSARSTVPSHLSMSDQGVSSGERMNLSQARGVVSIKNTHSDTVDHSAVDEDVLADSDDEEHRTAPVKASRSRCT